MIDAVAGLPYSKLVLKRLAPFHGSGLLPVLLPLLALSALSVQAQFTQIDLNSKANANLRTYPNGTNYPFGGSQFTVAGVPFSLARLGGNPTTTGVVQKGPRRPGVGGI